MERVHVSRVSAVYGQPRPLASLEELPPDALKALGKDIEYYRESPWGVAELAARAVRGCLGSAAVPLDLLVYASENDEDATASLTAIQRDGRLADVDAVAVRGNDCGNLVPALAMARDAVVAGGRERVLVVTADLARGGRRLMDSGLSVFSDGAAACLVTRETPARGTGVFALDGIAVRTRVGPGASVAPEARLLSSALLARDCVEAVLTASGLDRSDVRHLVLPNYRHDSQRFLAAAMGFPDDRLLPGEVAECAHSFSADLLMTCARRHAEGLIAPADRVVGAAAGLWSWSALALTCLR